MELMGRLWDSLDPTAATPMTPELAAELDRREAEADVAPEGGDTWPDIQSVLLRTLP
jgi:putative addiction module component (TIGR02574 family)